MPLAAMWTGFISFLKDNPIAQAVVAAFLFIIGWNILKGHLKEAGREAERASIAQKQAKVKEAVNERSTQIINEERSNADAALEARDGGNSYPSSDSVRDDIASVLFRRERGA